MTARAQDLRPGKPVRTGTMGERTPAVPYAPARLPIVGETWRLTFGHTVGFSKARQRYVTAPEPFGTGHRWLVIWRVGRVWIEAVAPATLQHAQLHVDDWVAYGPRLEDGNVAGGHRRLVRARREWKRTGAWTEKHRTKIMQQILAALKRAAGKGK